MTPASSGVMSLLSRTTLHQAVTLGWLRCCERSSKHRRHKAAALRMAMRNTIVNPGRKPSISYSCSSDAAALVLQSTSEDLVLQSTFMNLVLQST